MPTHLLYIRFGNDGFPNRLGGSALAQCLSQIGDVPSDVDDFALFSRAFDIVQKLIKGKSLFKPQNILFR